MNLVLNSGKSDMSVVKPYFIKYYILQSQMDEEEEFESGGGEKEEGEDEEEKEKDVVKKMNITYLVKRDKRIDILIFLTSSLSAYFIACIWQHLISRKRKGFFSVVNMSLNLPN
jgi:hypothetical protein